MGVQHVKKTSKDVAQEPTRYISGRGTRYVDFWIGKDPVRESGPILTSVIADSVL